MFSTLRSLKAIATALLFAAAPLSIASAQPSDTATFKVAVGGDLKSFDPVWTNAAITTWYANQVYDMLFGFDADGQIQPQMVGEYTVSDDGLTHEFTLRPGQTFHDGSPVRAADAVASINRWAERDAMGRLLASKTKTLEVVDDNTFRMVLSERFGLVRESLGKRIGPPYIMPARLAAQAANEEIKEPIGSGPYKFDMAAWAPGSKVVFTKNENYVPRTEPASGLAGGKVVNFERMEWLYIPDVNTKLTALTVGEIDYFDAPPLDFLPLLANDPNLKLVFNDPLGIQVLLRPNHLHAPFDNKLARQALLYLVNQEQVMQAVAGDPELYLPFCGAFFMCGSESESDVGSEPMKNGINVDKAKQLLADAGYNGEPIVIMQPTDRPEHTAATLVVIQALRDAGLNLDVQAADWATITARRAMKEAPADGGWNLFITGSVGASTTDPLVSPWFMPNCDAASPGWPCNEDIVGLVGDWSQEADPVQRKALIDEIQELAWDFVPYVPLGQYQRPHGVRANVQGLLATGTTVFWNAYKE